MSTIKHSDTHGGFKEIEHDADWALHVWGLDLKILFLKAAQGMTRLMRARIPDEPEWQEHLFDLTALDTECLLVEWLEELVFWADVHRVVFRRFDIHHLTQNHITAAVEGCEVRDIGKCIKAVTFHNLKVRRCADGLETTIVFDV